MRADQTLPLTQSAIAGAIAFGAAFLAAFAACWALGLFGRDVVDGLGILGLCWALTIGAVAGAMAAAVFNLLARLGALWAVPTRQAQPAR